MKKSGKNIKKHLLGRLLFVALLYGILLPVQTVFAGSINAEESRLIRSVAITYEYEGKLYQVKDEYIAKLRAYLMQDDVDLTAQEVNELIPQVMSNVATGVADGYLMEIPKKEDQDQIQHDEIPSTDEVDTKTEVSEEVIGSKNDSEDKTTKKQNEEDGEDIESQGSNNGNKEYTSTEISGNSHDVDITESIEKADATEITEEVQNTDNTNSTINKDTTAEEEDIIKQTGFSLRATILSGGAILLIFTAALIMAYRVSLIAHEDA